MNVVRLDSAKLLASLKEQQLWMRERGTDLEGYVKHYGSIEDEEHHGDGGEAIWRADDNRRLELEAQMRVLRGTPLGFYDEYVASYLVGEVRHFMTDPRQEDATDPRAARGYKSPELARAAAKRQYHKSVNAGPRRGFVQRHDLAQEFDPEEDS